jgi:hypothetical protein
MKTGYNRDTPSLLSLHLAKLSWLQASGSQSGFGRWGRPGHGRAKGRCWAIQAAFSRRQARAGWQGKTLYAARRTCTRTRTHVHPRARHLITRTPARAHPPAHRIARARTRAQLEARARARARPRTAATPGTWEPESCGDPHDSDSRLSQNLTRTARVRFLPFGRHGFDSCRPSRAGTRGGVSARPPYPSYSRGIMRQCLGQDRACFCLW